MNNVGVIIIWISVVILMAAIIAVCIYFALDISSDENYTEKNYTKENYNTKKASDTGASGSGTCSLKPDGTSACGSANVDKDLLTTRYNLRDCVKDMILLEDHLVAPGKKCEDCILKHKLRIEAFAQEGMALQGTDEEKSDCAMIIEAMPKMDDQSEIRKIRKPLMYKYGNQ